MNYFLNVMKNRYPIFFPIIVSIKLLHLRAKFMLKKDKNTGKFMNLLIEYSLNLDSFNNVSRVFLLNLLLY
ncbi:hypothetical protein CM15mP35_05550 [bacterium]|nr:MAG: hypothetical protein CM15mP35_05550 [bacterium]